VLGVFLEYSTGTRGGGRAAFELKLRTCVRSQIGDRWFRSSCEEGC